MHRVLEVVKDIDLLNIQSIVMLCKSCEVRRGIDSKKARYLLSRR